MSAYSIRQPLKPEQKNQLSKHSDLLAHLLFHREIKDLESANKFLTPDYDRDILDPFLLKDVEKSAKRIILAIKNNQRIAIYSDYDADGIPGAVIWNDFFTRLGYKNYSIYIPHRHDEGFGLNIEAVEQLANEGVSLLITVDCGISDVLPVAKANEKGIEVIITDHHEPPEELPKAFAIIDHKQKDCDYPDKNICGSGVAYKLIQGIIKNAKKQRSKEGNIDIGGYSWKEGHEKWLLDMVGIATLSDMVPLIGENRVFAKYGLDVLRKSSRKGLVQLLNKLRITQQHLSEDDIAFMITPRINAASRMGVPMDAFKLLASQNDADAMFAAEHLDTINNERKGVVASLVKEVKKTLHERYGHDILKFPSAIVLGNPNWRPSLLGLVANTCAKEFNRPVFLWGRDGGNIIKGSCRSEGNSSVVDIMRGVPEGFFLQSGGHKFSGGFAVSNENIFFLDQKLVDSQDEIQSSKHQVTNKSEIPNSKNKVEADSPFEKGGGEAGGFSEENIIDAELSLEKLDWSLYNDIAQLAPFGTGNPKPIFLFKNITPTSVRKFGKANEHIELSFSKSNGQKIPAISFFGVENQWAKDLEMNKSIDLIASLEKSMFRGRTELRLRIKDVIHK